jgi:YesN/AraC family two-component response regulator
MQQKRSFFRWQKESPKSNTTYILSPERVSFISNRLEHFMVETKPFLKSGYTIRRLAADIAIQSYQLSAFLNQEKHLRFNDYLNRFRVRYCEDLIQNGLVSDLNMKGLAVTCGFQNRNTLTSAFKKFTGQTPSRYSKVFRTGGRQYEA